VTVHLPLPPLNFRSAVGPTDPADYENPTGARLYPDLDDAVYESVFDFGCGCGRVARQLIQQQPPPQRYLGVDLHPEMIRWCQANLTPAASSFTFVHHDVFHESYNPGANKPRSRTLPTSDECATLVIAHSVFTHIVQDDVEFYLHELARILRPDGVARATFFLFDKRAFPMMEPHRNALYTDPFFLTDAVILDREWLRRACDRAGLAIVAAVPPEFRGFQWVLTLMRADAGFDHLELPADSAPFGSYGGPRRASEDQAALLANESRGVEERRAEDAAAHAREAVRQRARADDLTAQLEATGRELTHTRERLEYLQSLMPIRLARAAKRRFASWSRTRP
jgi:SAM-dependent methyltransferase